MAGENRHSEFDEVAIIIWWVMPTPNSIQFSWAGMDYIVGARHPQYISQLENLTSAVPLQRSLTSLLFFSFLFLAYFVSTLRVLLWSTWFVIFFLLKLHTNKA